MARRCFYSFYYKEDHWRVSQVKGIGSIEGQPVLNANKWEEVENGGDAAIKKWIDAELQNRTCLIVLIGANTAGRPYVDYEIEQAWKKGMGVMGIHIHNLKDSSERQTLKGNNPFSKWKVGEQPMTNWAKTYDPPYSDSKEVYAYISDNIESWVENAIKLRG